MFQRAKTIFRIGFLPGLSAARARMASRMELVGGEANTLPATPPVSMPDPFIHNKLYNRYSSL